jgi:glutamine cyclotransferase
VNRFLKLFLPILIAVLILIFVLFRVSGKKPDTAETFTYRIINTFPHDPKAFTQGLVFGDSFLYEGTGRYGQSELRRVELETGDVNRIHELSSEFFGEGITVYGEHIIQLTYRENIGFVYDKDTFQLLRQFDYPMEGWGITHDGRRLIVSDGTSALYFLDPETFEQVGRIRVYDGNVPVWGLNELEYVKGQVYANVWPTDRITIIAPDTGQVMGWISLKGILTRKDQTEYVDVLNGIAYDEKNGRLFVTGKYWPKLFEIELISAK